ncbi:hypothetical protein [Streptomyces caniscabiei]|uniref:Uncharacterized protein n=1 Tax=Streptomyces caniscabiei TaxID=2746961 RepID=A0ABU4MZN7_9ACTN|nr:hypothetical protein [Streptomyces caniscabiei]MBE4790277.1 hypothetical protein [Streptomyces caniscabiei]MBE4799494.1 hypothetical protein [Streptomyces caniscabiei]MDX3015134.1 hypothetical protein [Streptomyces caniscabiei]MDX3042577.1 hypothetical protein [Streptomyces caniscabiei]
MEYGAPASNGLLADPPGLQTGLAGMAFVDEVAEHLVEDAAGLGEPFFRVPELVSEELAVGQNHSQYGVRYVLAHVAGKVAVEDAADGCGDLIA